MTKFNTKALLKALVLLVVLLPQFAMAQSFECGPAGTTITSFFDSVEGLIGIASITIVTISIIFAGYQIAFAHKRLSDVGGILIGGLMIGAAGAIATMLMGDTVATKC